MSKISSVYVHFFNTPATHFVKYFCFKCHDILTSGSLENSRVSEKAIFRVQSQILTYYACAPFNWFLWQDSFGYKEKSENCGVLCTDTFCNRILAMNNYQYTVFNYLEKQQRQCGHSGVAKSVTSSLTKYEVHFYKQLV